MNHRTFERIIQLNKDFYDTIAEDFSETRQYPWRGWDRVAEELNKSFLSMKSVSILDLGCGNGRWYAHVRDHLSVPFQYEGLDIAEYLLDEATKRYHSETNQPCTFENHDIILDLDSLAQSYDIVAAFGVVHHIPRQTFRLKWFQNVSEKLREGGVFVFSFWEFPDLYIQRKLTSQTPSISSKELEENDYFNIWKNQPDLVRYVHRYSAEERLMIDSTLLNTGLIRLTDFEDPHDENGIKPWNRYLMYQKA